MENQIQPTVKSVNSHLGLDTKEVDVVDDSQQNFDLNGQVEFCSNTLSIFSTIIMSVWGLTFIPLPIFRP